MSATATMTMVVKYFTMLDKTELSKSEQRVKIGQLWPKLRAEYGRNALSELNTEIGKANIRHSVNGSILNQWAGIAAFYAINPAIVKLSERYQRRYATLFDVSVTKNGENPKLLPSVTVPAEFKKCEFPLLRDTAKDVDIFNRTFGIKLKKTLIKVTEKQVTDLFSRLRKMDETERKALIAQIKKELSEPMKSKGSKGSKGSKVVVPVPVPVPVPVTADDMATV